MILGNQRRRNLPRILREGRVLRAVDADGKHFGAGEMGDRARTLIDLHQGAGDGEAAFRKDHHLLAVLDRRDERAQRHRIGRIDRHQIEELEGGLHPPALRHVRVDGEGAALGQIGGQQGPVEHRGMIGDDDGAAPGLVKMLEAFHFDAIEQAEDQARQIGDKFLRQKLADVGGGNRIGEAGKQEDAADRQAAMRSGRRRGRSPPS